MCQLYGASWDDTLDFSKFQVAARVAKTTVDPEGDLAKEVKRVEEKCTTLFFKWGRRFPSGCYPALDCWEEPWEMVHIRAATKRMTQIASSQQLRSYL